MTIYPVFKKKIEHQSNNTQLRVIISFENLSNRDEFIKTNTDLKILGKNEFIPSVYVNLKKDQIINLEKNKSIKILEEDQKLYFSMLDVIEILELDDYKNAHISFKGDNVKVGIIDEGIDNKFLSLSHSDSRLERIEKKEKIKTQREDISHGTIIASIIGNQFKDIDENFIGIAPNVHFIDFKLSNSKREYYFSDILDIFENIYKKNIVIDILLISLTTKEPSDGNDILSLACNSFVTSGLIIVCPAGNFGPKNYSIGSPGAAKKVITFGSLNKDLLISDFSGRGPTLDERTKPDLCLPGSNIIVPLSDNLQVRVTGTSVSASIGVGIIALIKEYDPNISYEEILDLMKKSRIDLNQEQNSQGFGTIRVTDIFENLDLFHEKLVPYNYLIKKSLLVSTEFMILFIFLFYVLLFFRIK